MSKKRFRLIPVLALMIAMIAGSAMAASAESFDYTDKDFHCYYDGSMDTNFTAKTVAQAVEDLQPGDDMTFKVTYQNKSGDTTDWYMENAIEKTLEQTRERKTAVGGIDTAENGGYSYELIHIDKNGAEDVLFNSEGLDKVFGGEDDKAETGREGLKQATNALEDWFYIQTLEPGETGEVILKVALEGETEVNDYMDTDGGLNVRFAVEVPEKGTKKIIKRVNTGDYTNVTKWVAIMIAAAVLLLILAVISRKKDRKEAYDEKH